MWILLGLLIAGLTIAAILLKMLGDYEAEKYINQQEHNRDPKEDSEIIGG